MQGMNEPFIIENPQPLVNLPLTARERRYTRTRSEKTQRFFRILGRIYNPFNDAIGIQLFISSLQLSYEKNYNSNLAGFYIPFLLAFACMVRSLGSEIYHGVKLSKNSPFIYGQNNARHSITLEKELSLILGETAANRPLTELLNLLNHPDYQENTEIKQLIQDFKRVQAYNWERRLAENFNTLLLAVTVITAINNLNYLNETSSSNNYVSILLPIYSALAVMFIFKSGLDWVEYRWDKYEVQWKKLPLLLKKTLIVLRNSVEMLYNTIFAYTVAGTDSLLFFGLKPSNYEGMLDNALTVLTLYNFLLPMAVAYAAIQQIPSHKPRCDKKMVHWLKRANQSLYQDIRINGSLLVAYGLFLNLFFRLLPFRKINWQIVEYSNIFVYAIACLATITAVINTWLNYQERSVRRFTVIDDELVKINQFLEEEEPILSSPTLYGTNEVIIEAEPAINSPTTQDSFSKTQATKTNSGWSFWRPNVTAISNSRTQPSPPGLLNAEARQETSALLPEPAV